MRKWFLVLCVGLSGCAVKAPSPKDPLESFNRGVHTVNRFVDGMYVRPLGVVYQKLTPTPVYNSVGNFFSNVSEVPTIVNQVLQGNFGLAVSDSGRFLINSTVGVLGLFDVASSFGLPRHKEGFGQTLGKWGWTDSSYLVLPLLGPSTIRDTIGIVADSLIDPPYYLEPKWRNRYYAGELIHRRSEISEIEPLIQSAGIDKYALIRDGYFQKRAYEINDGQIPETDAENGTDFLGEPPP